MEEIIQLQDVSFAYENRPVLTAVNLSVERGEFASIIGPNGGGKTTLVRLMLGLLQPQTGRILLFGDEPEKERLRVGYTPQYLSLDHRFPITVEEIVLMGRLGQKKERKSFFPFHPVGRFSKADRIAAQTALERMRIADLAVSPFGGLSGGQRQRVFIARALVSDPELLILDEPTNNIDPGSTELLYDLLTELNKSVTILMVSHDLGIVSQYVRSVICVNEKVVVHPTSAFNGTIIRDMYGADVCLVRHDHRCSEQGHNHLSSSK